MLDVDEKVLFVLESVPPVLLTILILYFLKKRPHAFLEQAKDIVLPGVIDIRQDHNLITLVMESASDNRAWFQQALEQVNNRVDHAVEEVQEFGAMGASLSVGSFHLPISPSAKRLLASDESEAGEADEQMGATSQPDARRTTSQPDARRTTSQPDARIVDDPSKTTELLINVKHFVASSFLPMLFIVMHVWSHCMLSREASYDFPAERCMDPDHSTCFYNKEEYSMARWPTYEKLECEEMTKKTFGEANAANAFYFHQPAEAKFFKCYNFHFTFDNLLAALGDGLTLLALFGLIIIPMSVSDVHRDTDKDEAQLKEEKETLQKKKNLARCRLVLLVALFGASLLVTKALYGKKTNDVIFYLGLPGTILFFIILLVQHMEILQYRLDALEQDSTASSSSSAEDEDGFAVGSGPPRARARRGSNRRAGALLPRKEGP